MIETIVDSIVAILPFCVLLAMIGVVACVFLDQLENN